MSKSGARASRGAAVVSCLLLSALAGRAAADLTIRGVNDEIEDVLEAFITIDELACDAPRWWVQRRHRQVPEQIRRAMETLGYYRSTHSGSLEWDEACWQAVYQVEPGDPVRIQEVDLEIGAELAATPRMRETLAGLDIAPEEPFSHGEYEAAKADLLETAQALGYFDAEFTRHRVRVDTDTNLAEIELTLVPGERYRIGEIGVEQHALKDGLFRRFLRFHEGEPYDSDALARTYRDLIESDYFDRVLVTPELDRREDGQVPVQVIAAAQTRRSVLVGAGYATDTGPRGRLDLRYRRVNDRGHRANLSTLVSEVNGKVNAEYRVPYGDPSEDWLFLTGAVEYDNTATFESLKRGTGIGRTHRRGEHWTETNYLEYSTEEFEVGEQEGTAQLLLIGTSWARTTSIQAPRPQKGYSLSVDLRGANEHLLSDNDLVQMIVRGRQILPLTDRMRVLARVQAGWTWHDEFEELPPSVRFFAGGDNSVRGYGYESLGPEENGDVVGGSRLLTGSLELDVLLRNNWSMAAFVDSGSAFDDAPNFFTGVGLGVRWYSPLGPLRVDLAHPLDDDRNVRLHISLGPDL